MQPLCMCFGVALLWFQWAAAPGVNRGQGTIPIFGHKQKAVNGQILGWHSKNSGAIHRDRPTRPPSSVLAGD